MPDDSARLAVSGPIWVCAILYFAAVCCRGAASRPQAARWHRSLWTLALAAYLVHAAAAFSLYHCWSHSRAVAHAAQRTAEVIGWHWGAAIYVNYAFTAAWILDAALLWAAPALHTRQPRWLATLWLSTTLFIFFQAMVVFGRDTSRLLGLAGLFLSCAVWLSRFKRCATIAGR